MAALIAATAATPVSPSAGAPEIQSLSAFPNGASTKPPAGHAKLGTSLHGAMPIPTLPGGAVMGTVVSHSVRTQGATASYAAPVGPGQASHVVKPSSTPSAPPKPDADEAKNPANQGLSHTDKVFQHLESKGQLSWISTGNGSYTLLPVHMWKAGSKAVHAQENSVSRTTSHTPEKPIPLFADKPTPNQQRLYSRGSGGLVGGYDINYYDCYNDGTKMDPNQLKAFAPEACDALIKMKTPKDDPYILKVYQTKGIPTWLGGNGYVRFSTYWGQPGNENFITQGMCEAAFSKFDTLCQADGGTTQGGELWIARTLKLAADPTDLLTNT